MDVRTKRMKEEWNSRQQSLGMTKRSVLFKRFPGIINRYIHQWHVGFIQKHLPRDMKSLLDVGCGWGRIASELRRARPNLDVEGVEFCDGFAEEFRKTIGSCFQVPIQEFVPSRCYDVIIIVTLLMYLEANEIPKVLDRLFNALLSSGRIICIEPAIEHVRLWRLLTRKVSAQPTGGLVKSFSPSDLRVNLLSLKNSKLVSESSCLLLPPFRTTAVHHGIVVERV